MCLVPNNEFMRINIKSPKFFLMLKLPYTKEWCWAIKTNFLACSTRMGGPS